ncbi:DUF2178 domain-containing protein [Methanococcoides alaskense]|uniref:Membrane protein n=1 Tax=Methanococcoides alaskense TaxID=325778 RepID=A0AA90U0P7_9EURY|nr:DUF2178 domain-containing protein [Methanococcoides alaskense]MDA0524746.1 DUF2178 domain-containing protein [Methanococcoides alaskense]MDR6223134.1 putative membrane protein [Methanococcoides alaskense]
MAVDIIEFIPILIGLATGYLILNRKRKRSEEPEQDERTENVAGKAAHNTIIVLMLAMALIGYGDIFDLFKMGTPATISILFITLLISLIAFRRYYNSKEL